MMLIKSYLFAECGCLAEEPLDLLFDDLQVLLPLVQELLEPAIVVVYLLFLLLLLDVVAFLIGYECPIYI